MTSRLFVADLDGTLLRPDETIGARTIAAVNALADRGHLFTIATARSFHAARRLSRGLNLTLPVIVYDGAMVVHPLTGSVLRTSLFAAQEVRHVLAELATCGAQPVLYMMREGVDRYCWLNRQVSPAVRDFVGPPPYGTRALPLHDWDEIDLGAVFYISVPGDDAAAAPGRDITAPGVSKGTEVSRLREETGAEHVVVFGDGRNDLSMFAVADESYAVADAPADVRARAGAVIGRSGDEAVADWLKRRVGS